MRLVKIATHRILRTSRLILRHIRYRTFIPPGYARKSVLANLETLYRVVNSFLQGLNIEYWIDRGTLLGYWREERIVSGDHDVDFGTHEREYEKILKSRDALPAGFKMYDTSLKHHGPKLSVERNGWKADIYFYSDDGMQMQRHLRSQFVHEIRPFSKKILYPIKQTDFLGEPTNIPADAKAYLQHLYNYIGKDAVKDPKTGYYRRQK